MIKNHWYVVILALLMIQACTGKKEKMLCKRWQVADVIFVNEAESIVGSDTMQGNMVTRTKVILKDILTKNIYQFNEDGTYLTGNATGSAEGKWSLKGDAIHFISGKQEKEGKEKSIPIEKLQEDTLILLMDNDQSSMKMKLVLVPLAR